MKKSGFNLQEIAYITDHANYQSLESYLNAPNDDDMQCYADALFNFHDNQNQPKSTTPKPKATATISKPEESTENSKILQVEEAPKTPVLVVDELPPTQIVPIKHNFAGAEIAEIVHPPTNTIQQSMQSIIRQAPSIFHGANFHGCTINFQMPSNP